MDKKVYNSNVWTPEKVKQLRKKLGLKQKEFAKLLGVSACYVSLLETQRKPTKVISKLLDCIERLYKEA